MTRVGMFLRRQSLYLLILCALCGAYFFLSYYFQRFEPSSVTESPEYHAFREAEKKLQTDLSTEDSLGQLFSRKPILTVIFVGYSVVFCGLFIGGTVIGALWLFSKPFRLRHGRSYPLEPKGWPFSALLRTIVHFLAISLGLNFIFGVALRFLPSLNANALALFHTAIMDLTMAVLIFKELGFSWKSVRDFGFNLNGRTIQGEMAHGIGGYMAVIPFFGVVLYFLIVLAQKLSYEPEPHPLVDVFLSEEKRNQWMIFFSIFLACLWGPFFEEIFFRGFCYPLLKARMGALPGGVLSAVFFAMIHRNEFAFIPIFLLGAGLAWLYEKRGCLIAPMTLHIFHNCLFIGYFFTAKSLMTP